MDSSIFKFKQVHNTDKGFDKVRMAKYTFQRHKFEFETYHIAGYFCGCLISVCVVSWKRTEIEIAEYLNHLSLSVPKFVPFMWHLKSLKNNIP